MNKMDLVWGILLGLVLAFLGCYWFVSFFTEYDFYTGIVFLKKQGFLGKLIAIGSLLDLVAFALLLKLNKELMARGIVLAVFILAIVTLFLL